MSKLSIIPDVVLVHDILSSIDCESRDEEDQDDCSSIVESNSEKSWYRGTVLYAFNNMITEGSTALRGVVEMGRVVNRDPTRFYAVIDGGGDRRVNFLSVEKALVSLFPVHDLLLRSAKNYEFNEMVEKLYHIIFKECFVNKQLFS